MNVSSWPTRPCDKCRPNTCETVGDVGQYTNTVLMLVIVLQGKYMDIEFDFKGDPVGGAITNCEQSQDLFV